MKATRHVAHRDGRLEGDPPAEGSLPERVKAAKASQRDLTSLSGPVPEDHEG